MPPRILTEYGESTEDAPLWHVFEMREDEEDNPVPYWLGSVATEDAASAVALIAHHLRRNGDTTIPLNREKVLHVIPHEDFSQVEAGWFSEPPDLVVNEVG
jgi:hypothetical protein